MARLELFCGEVGRRHREVVQRRVLRLPIVYFPGHPRARFRGPRLNEIACGSNDIRRTGEEAIVARWTTHRLGNGRDLEIVINVLRHLVAEPGPAASFGDLLDVRVVRGFVIPFPGRQ